MASYLWRVWFGARSKNPERRRPFIRAPASRKRQCAAPPHAPLCSDDDWVSKCPSGCRLQGLISQMESKVEKKLRKVCKTAKIYEDAAEKSMTTMTRVYTRNRRVIVNSHMSELRFVDLAQRLARNLTSLRERSHRLSQRLGELSGAVRKQTEELYRTEVDMDLNLRTCLGSCRLVLPFAVDHLGYETLHADIERTDRTPAMPPHDIPRLKLQPVDVGPAPPAGYRSIPAVQRDLLTGFEDIGQNQVVVDPAGLD